MDRSFNKGTQAPVVSVGPVVLSAPGRRHALQVRVSAPVNGAGLPVVLLAHGFGSSMDGYAPLAHFWAAHGFVVIQPTFLDSRTLLDHPEADHAAAVNAYLNDPESAGIWRQRVADMKHVLDQLELIEAAVPGLKGRPDKSRIAVTGHSFGAHTAGLLLGARVVPPDGGPEEDMSDARISAGVLLSAGGRGGEALSSFAAAHFPYLNQSYATLTTPALVVAGDKDQSPLTVLGPEWFTDAYTLSPGAEWLATVFDGEHMLGGISGHLVRETTDENPARVAMVQQLTTAYLRSALFPEDPAWAGMRAALLQEPNPLVRIAGKGSTGRGR